MSRVLILRPQPGADATADRARQLGMDAVTVPLFEVEPVAWKAPEPASFDGLLLTSANAVRFGGDGLKTLRGLPVYAVGDATAQAARTAGFDIAATGEAGVDRLLESIEPDLKLLHLCGADRREPSDAKQEIISIACYRATPIERSDLHDLDSVALIHSPRAGRRLAELVSKRAATRIAAISAAAAEAVGEGWAAVATADQPTDEALLALAARLCNNSPPK